MNTTIEHVTLGDGTAEVLVDRDRQDRPDGVVLLKWIPNEGPVMEVTDDGPTPAQLPQVLDIEERVLCDLQWDYDCAETDDIRDIRDACADTPYQVRF